MIIYDIREKSIITPDGYVNKVIIEGGITNIQADIRPQTWIYLDTGYSILITDKELERIKAGK